MFGEHAFDLYKLMVEDVREVRRARRQVSNLFITLNLAGASALGFLLRVDSGMPAALKLWLIFALVLTCVVWWAANRYYTRLLAVKYGIIYDIEKELKIVVLQREWKELPRKGTIKWFGLERRLPFIFIIGYLVFMFYQHSPADVSELASEVCERAVQTWRWLTGMF